MSEMVAGRELNQKIAIEVMGWKIAPHGRRVMPGEDFQHSVEIGGFTSKTDCLRWISQQCADYSGCMAAAWEVVEKLATNEDWDEYPFEIHRNYNFKPTWTASFNDYEHEGWSEVSAPHAICLAALAAVGALPTPQRDSE